MKRITYCLLGLALLCACGPNRQQQIKNIEEHEQQMSIIDVSSNDDKPREMIELYRQFVDDFPEDSLAPIYMMRAADISINLGMTERAVSLLDSIINLYPGYEDIAGCLFLKGYAYESGQQYEKARETYTQFVEEYPDHYLASDTRKMIPLVGLSPEEMFEAVIASTTDSNLTMK